jgi:hypothetical protein
MITVGTLGEGTLRKYKTPKKRLLRPARVHSKDPKTGVEHALPTRSNPGANLEYLFQGNSKIPGTGGWHIPGPSDSAPIKLRKK